MTSGNLGGHFRALSSIIWLLGIFCAVYEIPLPNLEGKRELLIFSTYSLPQPLGNRNHLNLNENKLQEISSLRGVLSYLMRYALMWAIGSKAKIQKLWCQVQSNDSWVFETFECVLMDAIVKSTIGGNVWTSWEIKKGFWKEQRRTWIWYLTSLQNKVESR